MIKRTLSLLLALVMVLSLFPATANAAELDNGLHYEVNAYQVTITDYTGSATEVVIPAEIEGKPVTRIGNSAFNYCYDPTSISIPDSVTSIGNHAFNCCYGLTSISIPNSVTSIGAGAFQECIRLTSVDLPDSITVIESDTFALCEKLTSIDIPDSVTSIGDCAFDYCKSLTTIDIPDGVTSIGSSAFSACSSLTSISIPDGVTSIGDRTFSYCNGLTSVDLPDSITSIGNEAFFSCNGLTRMDLPDSVTSIGDSAFSCSNGLTSVDIPVSVTSIGDCAFDYCTGLTSITFHGNAPQFGMNVFMDVTATAYYPTGNATWTEDVMQDYGGTITWVAHIHEYSTAVTNPTCTEEGYTTYTCECGESYVDDYVDALGHDYADGLCTRCGRFDPGLQYTVYADHVEITDYTGSATELEIPAEIEGKPVTSIGNSALLGCTSLTSIDLPDGVISVGSSAFYGCYNLTSIDLPDSITSIGDTAFTHCESLTSIDIPDRITSISRATFSACSSLTSISIPDSVTSIGNSAFSGCYDLTSIDIPDRITSIGDSTFFNCSSLTSIDIPDGVTSIGSSAFSRCFKLASIGLPDGVTSIGSYAFSHCNLTSFDLPDGVTSIGDYAFLYCVRLTSITFQGDAPQFGTTIFKDLTVTAYYPAGNATWTEDVMQDYGGEITWVALEPPHTHEYTAVVTAPTCTAQGYTTYTCECGYSYVSDYVDALGHDYADGACTRCGKIDPSHQQPMENPFSDVPAGAYYEAPVLWALENGITAGATATSFAPENPCLRAQVVSFLHRAEGSPEPLARATSFTDVKATDFFYKPVLWAVEKGITYGVSSTKFGAYDVCNRAAVVTFLWRAAGSPEPTSNKNPFTDVKTSDFFYKAILWAVENGIAYGMDATHFGPNAACNRAQVVTFLYRAYN